MFGCRFTEQHRETSVLSININIQSLNIYYLALCLKEHLTIRAKAFTATEAACQITAISFQDGLKHQSSVTA